MKTLGFAACLLPHLTRATAIAPLSKRLIAKTAETAEIAKTAEKQIVGLSAT